MTIKNENKHVRVIIETPKGSMQKFDYQPAQDIFLISKIMPVGLVFPFDFGFLPGTLGEDGDPLDIMVVSEFGTFTGCAVDCRIVGIIMASQQERDGTEVENDRIIAIPEISEKYRSVRTIGDLGRELISEIEDFFITYNRLAGKEFKIKKVAGAALAFKRIGEGQKKNKQKEFLVQIFLPISAGPAFARTVECLQKTLTGKFGGTSIYPHNPVKGIWQDKGCPETDRSLIIETMTEKLDLSYWTALKSMLEKELGEKEILTRTMAINTL